MLGILFNSIIVAISGAMMPGSLLTFTLDKSIKKGTKTGFLVSFGHAALELLIVILLMAGVGSFLVKDAAQIIIGFIGGIFLLYLGAGMLRDVLLKKLKVDLGESGTDKGGKPDENAAAGGAGSLRDKDSNGALVLGGALISVSNPYFIFWWAAVGLGFILNAYKSFGIAGVAVFYIGHIFTDIAWYGFVAFLISRTRRFINMRVYTVVIIILGIFLIFFGAGFLVNSFHLLLK